MGGQGPRKKPAFAARDLRDIKKDLDYNIMEKLTAGEAETRKS